MQEINAWLQGSQNYDDGEKLYFKYGASSFVKSVLASGPTPFNILKLEAELLKLAPAQPAISIVTVEETSPLKIAIKNNFDQRRGAPLNAVLPDAKNHRLYLELKEEQKNKYRQLERNMALLDFETKPTILHLTAKNIMHLHAAVQKIHHEIDFYEAEGLFPDQKQVEPLKTNPIQLLLSSICRAKKRLKKTNCRNREATEKLLAEKIMKLEKLKGMINE